MTFKQFKEWCNDRWHDGCWGRMEAIRCIQVGEEIQRYPFWIRERMWKRHPMRIALEEIVEGTNQLIQKRRTDERKAD